MKKTYGTMTLQRGSWLIKTEPHVALRLKRVFGSIGNQYGTIYMTATPEVCRDLAWFIERYPLKVTPRKYLDEQAALQIESETLVDKLLSGAVNARHFDLKLPPREYQRIAADLALTTKGLLVADDVGLGKTCIGICMLAEPETRPALVVTLTHLQRQWRDELRKFAPQLDVVILKKGTPYDYTGSGKTNGQLALVKAHPDVVITNYQKLSGWSETLGKVMKSVIYDEVHELRTGISSNKGAAAQHMSSLVQYRLGLTATPIFNYGAEIFYVINALRPGALGTRSEFCTEWCRADGARISEPQAFGTYARDAGLMVRRTRKEVGRELPDLIKVPHHVDCDTEALEAIESSATELARVILAKTDLPLERGEQFRAGGRLDTLVRQATGLAKAPYVADFVRLLIETGEKVVLYGWHRSVYDIWLERLKAFKPVLYTGSESEAAKAKSKEAFCHGDSKVLVISLRAGQGLDGLQYADCRTVVFGELDWSPAVHEQNSGRLHRDGQNDPVLAYFLIADSGSDPIIADVLGLKRQQLQGIRDPRGAGFERLESDGERIRRLAESYLRRSDKRDTA